MPAGICANHEILKLKWKSIFLLSIVRWMLPHDVMISDRVMQRVRTVSSGCL